MTIRVNSHWHLRARNDICHHNRKKCLFLNWSKAKSLIAFKGTEGKRIKGFNCHRKQIENFTFSCT